MTTPSRRRRFTGTCLRTQRQPRECRHLAMVHNAFVRHWTAAAVSFQEGHGHRTAVREKTVPPDLNRTCGSTSELGRPQREYASAAAMNQFSPANLSPIQISLVPWDLPF